MRGVFMSDYLNPIVNETDLLPYENFLNDFSKSENTDNKKNMFDKLIGKRINLKISTDTGLYSYFGVLKSVQNEYLELCQKDGRKLLILKPESVVSITIL